MLVACGHAYAYLNAALFVSSLFGQALAGVAMIGLVLFGLAGGFTR
jgi:hypothetical protein